MGMLLKKKNPKKKKEKKSWEFSAGPVIRTLLSMVGKLRSHKWQCIAKKRIEKKKAQ